MPASSQKKRYDGFEARINVLAFLLLLTLTILAVRLWNFQMVHGAQYAGVAEQQRLMTERIQSPRGVIYGRDESIVLADNRAANDLVLTPALCPDPDKVVTTLGKLVPIDEEKLRNDILAAEKDNTPYEQIVVKRDITRTELKRVEELSFALRGVYPLARPQRRYYYGQTAGQLLGWMNEINREEWLRLKPRYKMGDVIGRDGLEMMYEDVLKGVDGAMIVSRYNGSVPQLKTDARGVPYVTEDSKGRKLEVEQRVNPTPGGTIFTTLDMGLQRECERILKGQIGSVVVLDADTGEVLTMASTPGYDPSIFVTDSPNRGRLITEVLSDKELKPALNRGYRAQYPPGSVFKVLLAIAALEEGTITEHTTYSCNGLFRLPGVNRPWKCWRLKYGGHGGVSVVDALAYSCDVFFYNVGRDLGPERIKDWSSKLGLGVNTGIDLPHEVVGLIPDPVWKKDSRIKAGEKDPSELKWYPGETINMSIGQGAVTTTPLQNAVLMAAVLNGGRRVTPYLNMALGPRVSEPLVSEHTLQIVIAGMRKCVERDKPAPTGTGKLAKIDGLDILGKTGTAQVAAMHHVSGLKEEDIPYKLRDHALFISGVTDREPRIAVSVMIEHGLHGSSAAAPVAKEIFEYFYLNRPPGSTYTDVSQPISIAQREDGE